MTELSSFHDVRFPLAPCRWTPAAGLSGATKSSVFCRDVKSATPAKAHPAGATMFEQPALAR